LKEVNKTATKAIKPLTEVNKTTTKAIKPLTDKAIEA